MIKRLVFISTCMLLSALAVPAADGLFETAQAAYDDGRYAEAADQYQSLLKQGIDDPVLHYNLANALFKAGQLPDAILHYRRAWYDAPRDPDIEANLSFALAAAGAVPPEPGLIQRIAFTLSRGEWVAAAVAFYLLLSLVLMSLLLVPGIRRPLLKVGGLLLLGILVSTVGWWSWHQLDIRPEQVVVKNGVTARYGPVEGATAYYELPLGALVQTRSKDPKGWTEIMFDGKAGWVKDDSLTRILP